MVGILIMEPIMESNDLPHVGGLSMANLFPEVIRWDPDSAGLNSSLAYFANIPGHTDPSPHPSDSDGSPYGCRKPFKLMENCTIVLF